MNEPKRWLDEGPPEAIERLLHAASAERPQEASMSRALTALGLGAGATGAATTASAATAGSATVGAVGTATAGKATGMLAGGALVKWGLVGGALVVAGVGGTAVVQRVKTHGGAAPAQMTLQARVSSKQTPSATTTGTATDGRRAAPSPSITSTVADPAPNTVDSSRTVAIPSPNTVDSSPVSVVPSPNAVVPPAVRPSHKAFARAESAPAASDLSAPIDAERLAEEVALVDHARGALSSGDAQATIAALDDYDTRFSRRKFAPEALYLRMEALLRLGQTNAARGVAERLVTMYPSSPNTERARQVLGPSIP